MDNINSKIDELARRYGLPEIDPEEAEKRSVQNRVDIYNALAGDDDGTGVHCDLCLNRGDIAFAADGYLRVRPCKCAGTRLTVRRLQRCGIWEQAKRCKLDNFKTDTPTRRHMKETVTQYVQDPSGHWLMLCGQSGAGKTHLCTAAFVQISYRYGMAGQYFLWNRDGRALKSSAMEDTMGLWDRYKKAELLYIDDLFKDAQGDADRRLAFELLDYRCNNRLITIISSEMTIDQILALDQAIGGRIKEMCGASHLVSIAPDPAKNYRLR